MPPGQENGCPTSGNGNIHCKDPTIENILGEIFGGLMQCRCETRVEPCAVRMM